MPFGSSHRQFPAVPHAHRLDEPVPASDTEHVTHPAVGRVGDGRVYVPRWAVLVLLAGLAIFAGSMAHSIADQVQRTFDVRAVDAEVPVSMPPPAAPAPAVVPPAAPAAPPAAPAAPAGGTTNIYLTIVNTPDGATSTQDQVVIPAP